MLADGPSHASAEGEPADACSRDNAGGNREAEEMRFTIEIAEAGAALHSDRASGRIDMNAPHA